MANTGPKMQYTLPGSQRLLQWGKRGNNTPLRTFISILPRLLVLTFTSPHSPAHKKEASVEERAIQLQYVMQCQYVNKNVRVNRHALDVALNGIPQIKCLLLLPGISLYEDLSYTYTIITITFIFAWQHNSLKLNFWQSHKTKYQVLSLFIITSLENNRLQTK